jgi:inorganic triphosphatase YgiF
VQTVKATNGASEGVFERKELETTFATPELEESAIVAFAVRLPG